MAAAPGRACEASDGAGGSDEVIDGITGGLRDDDDDGRRQQQQPEKQQCCHGRWKDGSSSSTAGRAHEDEGGYPCTKVSIGKTEKEADEGYRASTHHRHRQLQQHQQQQQWQRKQQGCNASWQGGSSSAAGRTQGDVGEEEGGGIRGYPFCNMPLNCEQTCSQPDNLSDFGKITVPGILTDHTQRTYSPDNN